jgi:hypothetical protein
MVPLIALALLAQPVPAAQPQPAVRDPSDPAVRDLIARRQRRVLQRLTERGIARARIQFATVVIPEVADTKDILVVMSNMSAGNWHRLVDPGLVC